jgi:1,4-dihydroxy-2-naphthoate octaprenyltransferase
MAYTDDPALPRGERPPGLRLWLAAARPKTLPAAATPVIVGLACAAALRSLEVASALVTLAAALLLQVAANFANDVFDYEQGADTAERVGPVRVVQAGWVTPRQMRCALALVLLSALACGAYLAAVAGPVLVVIGLAAMLAAVAYTGGPYPLAYHGLGDLFVLVFFGFVAVAGTAYVQLGSVPELAWICGLPIGCLATNILVVNNVRDVTTDEAAGKRTLVVRFGRGFGINQYRMLLSVAYATPVALAARTGFDPWLLCPWLSLPLALRASRRVQRDSGARLNDALAESARLLLVFGLLLAAAVVFGRG